MRANIQTLLQQGMSLFNAGQTQRSEQVFLQVLNLEPQNINALQLLGVICSQGGRLPEGERYLRRAIKGNNKVSQLHYNLANNLDTQGKLKESLDGFRQAIRLEPGNAWYYSGLGLTYLKLNRVAEAVTTLRRAFELNENNGVILTNLANALWRSAKENEAIDMAERALAIHPRSVDTMALLGGFYLSKGDAVKAEGVLREGLGINPDHFEVLTNLSALLISRDTPSETREARLICERLARLRPNIPDVHLNLGRVLQKDNSTEKAIDAYKKAVVLDSQHAPAKSSLGYALIELGRFDEAYRCLLEAKALDPNSHQVLEGLLRIAKVDIPSTDIALIEHMLAPVAYGQGKSSGLPFEYAKYLERRGEYARAFEYLAMGNAHKRKNYTYRLEDDRVFFESIKQLFTSEFIQRKFSIGIEDETPIFIVGMPRSGTTLVEQILSSHSQVFGAGELVELSLLIEDMCKSQFREKYPGPVARFGEESFTSLAKQYLAVIREKSLISSRVTDKMPQNFIYLGMIHLMLPKARIIHCRRDPIDTCLSIFKQNFRSLHKYAYDQNELGGYYRLYEDLMAHWRKVLPAAVLHEVQYEELVADQEGISHRLIDFCGLSWEEDCLDFHASNRAVKTASVTQVRKKIYADSVELWRHYETQLEPLIKVLRGEPFDPQVARALQSRS